jgi:hypothetical protein
MENKGLMYLPLIGMKYSVKNIASGHIKLLDFYFLSTLIIQLFYLNGLTKLILQLWKLI